MMVAETFQKLQERRFDGVASSIAFADVDGDNDQDVLDHRI